MSTMNNSSIAGMSSELDIFENTVTQTGIIAADWQQFKPQTTITDTSPVIFFIAGQGDKYIDLSRTILNIKARIVKGDGTAFAATDIVGPVNNFFDSLFSDIKVEFNQKIVSNSSHMYHYRAYLEDLFNYNSTAKLSHLTASLWCQDEAGAMESTVSDPFTVRFEQTKGSQLIDMAGKLHCDLFSQTKYMLNEIDVRITLIRNKPELCLMGAAATSAKIDILDATLFIRKAQINPGVLLAHTRSLNNFTAKYPYKRVELNSITLTSGTRQQHLENLFLGRIPTRLIIGLVSNNAFSADYTLNPFNFQNFGLDQLSLYKNGQLVMSKPYTPNYVAMGGSYAIPYLFSFIGTGNNLVDDGYCVSMSEFMNGYCLYCYDLTADLSANSSHWCLQQEGNLRVEFNFKANLTQAVTVILYAEFREVLEIDKNRECSVEYKK